MQIKRTRERDKYKKTETDSLKSKMSDSSVIKSTTGVDVDVDVDIDVDIDVDNILIPNPDKVVMYGTDSKSALYVYGDPKSEKIAILCAGYADDHTVFQPFANELAKAATKAKSKATTTTLVGVICLPGYDDRPEDGVGWESHKKDGYTFNDWSNSIRDAVKALRNESTYPKGGVEHTKFTGIFHDWAVLPGTMWLNRTLKEAEQQQKEKNTTSSSSIIFKPNNVVFFDVLLGPSSTIKGVTQEVEYIEKSVKQDICEWLYRIVFATSYLVQRYIYQNT